MNRRETVVDVFLGSILILIFASVLGSVIAAFGFAFFFLDLGVKYLLPGFTRPFDLEFVTLFGLGGLISFIGHLRKRRWHHAFLSAAAIAMIVSIYFAAHSSIFGLREPFAILVILPLLGISGDSRPTRPYFIGAACMVAAVVALNTGLLGSGTLARIVGDGVLAAVLVWFARGAFQHWNIPKNIGPQTPLSSTGS